MNSASTTKHFADESTARVAANFGMWVFIATEILFFAPLLLGYYYGRISFPEGFAAASRHTNIVIGTLNTGVLLTSSFTMALAVELRESVSARAFRWLLAATALFGVLFLVLKGYEYYDEYQQHLFPAHDFSFTPPHARAAQLFFFIYFATTALHALHLTIGIGLVFFLWLSARSVSNNTVSNAGLYWHFVDIVWIFLYPLLYLVNRHG